MRGTSVAVFVQHEQATTIEHLSSCRADETAQICNTNIPLVPSAKLGSLTRNQDNLALENWHARKMVASKTHVPYFLHENHVQAGPPTNISSRDLLFQMPTIPNLKLSRCTEHALLPIRPPFCECCALFWEDGQSTDYLKFLVIILSKNMSILYKKGVDELVSTSSGDICGYLGSLLQQYSLLSL